MKQLTLSNSFSVSGKGLHTGARLTAEFCPAPDNHGYKVQRTDLPDQPIIDAVAENVVATTRGTVIGRGEVTISTLEHALAALYAAGIDNCLIKVDGPEIPILDGSAAEYCEKIAAAGLTEQKAEKEYYIVKQKTEIRYENNGASIVVLHESDLSVDVMIDYNSPVM